jgi:MraZ protein
MASFKGTYSYILDPKNRFNIPAKMRNGFVPEDRETVVLTRGFDPCIYVYSLTEWQKLEEQMRNFPLLDTDARKVIRMMSGNAQEYEIDKQGRVIIPQPLLSFARIEKDILIIGMLNWIEVWNPAVYDESHRDFDLAKTAEKMVKF